MPTDPADQLPGFELKEKLRETRAGVWYRAFQTRIGRDVLIKAPAQGDAKALEALRREVRLLGQLSGAGFVTLYDFQVDGDRPHAVYEWPGAKSLQGRARSSKRVDVRRSLAIAASVARVVRTLHKQKYWLRHAAPEDFFFDIEGKIQLVNLEALEPHLGKKSGTRAPLWCHPVASGYAGDLFLIGLHLHFLVTGKVPAPSAICENPGRWLDAFVRTPSTDAALLRACRGVLSDLWQKDTEVVLRDVISSWTEASTGSPAKSSSGGWVRGVVVAGALVLGVFGGAWIWPHVRPLPPTVDSPESTAVDEATPVESSPGEVEAVAVSEKINAATDQNATAAPDPVKPESPPDAPASAHGNSAVTAPLKSSPVDVVTSDGPRVASSDPERSLPEAVAPLIPPVTSTGAKVPTVTNVPAMSASLENRLNGLRATWEAVPKDGFQWSVEHERVQDESAALVQLLWKDDASPWPDQLETVLRTLADVGELEELRELRKELFACDEVEWEGTQFRARYDFSTRRHLRDWVGLGESSRVELLSNRLFVLGTVRFLPARWLVGVPTLRVHFPADGFDPRRPNINVIVGFGGAGPGEPTPEPDTARWFLFGAGTYLGNGLVEGPEPIGTVRLPASLILEKSDPPGSDSSVGWKILWTDETPWRARQADVQQGAIVELGHVDGAVSWRVGEWVVTADARPFRPVSQRLGELVAASAGRLDLLLESFQSTLAVESVAFSGQIALNSLRSRARARALEQLRKDLPAGLFGLLRQ